MVFDHDRYEALEQEIAKFRIDNPQNPNNMTEEIYDALWKLINELFSLFKPIVDQNRTNTKGS